MRILASLLLAAFVMGPVSAKAETTSIHLTNATQFFIYVDVVQHPLTVMHKGLVAPGHGLDVFLGIKNVKFFTDIYVYVKKEHTDEASATICHVKKTFGNTGGDTRAEIGTLQEHVHYNGQTCSIDPA